MEVSTPAEKIDRQTQISQRMEMKPEILTRPEVMAMLDDAVRQAGSSQSWANSNGFSGAYLSDVRAGRRLPGRKILDALKLEKIEAYVRK